MPSVTGWIDDLVAGIPVINQAWNLYKDALNFVWQNIYAPALEFTFHLLGIDDQDIISAQVINTRMLEDDDDLIHFNTQVALVHQDTQMGIIEIMQVNSQQARTSYNNYYAYGSTDYYANLPDVQINAMQNKTDDVKAIIDVIYEVPCNILYSVVKLPSKFEYVGYTLQGLYSYNPYNKKFIYTDTFEYSVGTIDYNYGTNEYDIAAYRPSTYVIRTDVTVTPGTTGVPEVQTVDFTDVTAGASGSFTMYGVTINIISTDPSDKIAARATAAINTSYTGMATLSGAVITLTYPQASGNVPPVEVVNGTALLSASPLVTTVTEGSTTSIDVVTTTVTWVITITKEATVVEEVQSTTVTEVPAGTGVASSDTTTDPIVYEYASITLHLPPSNSKQYYVVLFDKGITTEWYYWLYEVGLGTYPVLDASKKGITQLEMMPIVEIRNNAISINADKTTAKYLQTKEILGFIGMDVDTVVASLEDSPSIADVQNAYIHFSLDATISNKYTGRMLFDMFEYVLKDSDISITNDPTTYTVTFKEGNYNTSLTWAYSAHTVVTGVACPVDECINIIDIVTVPPEYGTYLDDLTGELVALTESYTINYLVLRKQINATQYEEYRLGNMTNMTFIHRVGLTDTTSVMLGSIKADTTYNEFLIPLSINFIKKMSQRDQMVIFRKSMYMSVYAATITHLEYYETPEFFAAIQIIAIIIMVIVTILTAGAGATFMSILMQVITNLAIGMVVGIALQWVMDQTDDPYLKAAIGIAAAIAMQGGPGSISGLQAVFIGANGLATGVSQYTENQFKELEGQMKEFSVKAEAKMKEFEEGFEEFKTGISTEFTAMLATTEAYDPYLKGWEAQRYAMGPMMYNWGLLKGDVISNAFDYDKYYKLGVV